MSNDLNCMLDVMTSAAREAGDEALRLRAQGGCLRSTQKTDGFWDIVTEADRASQSLLIERLRAHFPDAGFIAEESPTNEFSGSLMFTIDPIDGTWNYAGGGAAWGIILSCISDGRPVAGVILQPESGVVLRAAQGIGTTMNGERLSFRRPKGRTVVLSSGPWLEREEVLLKKIVPTLLMNGFQLFGAPCASACCLSVLSGQADVFLGHGEKIWDIAAAGAAMLAGAGVVSRLDGSSPRWNSILHPVLLSTSHETADEVLQLISQWYAPA